MRNRAPKIKEKDECYASMYLLNVQVVCLLLFHFVCLIICWSLDSILTDLKCAVTHSFVTHSNIVEKYVTLTSINEHHLLRFPVDEIQSLNQCHVFIQFFCS